MIPERWTASDPTPGINDLFVEDQNGTVVCRIGRDASNDTRRGWRNLISTAPDLYVGLTRAIEALTFAGSHEARAGVHFFDLIEELEVVLAKARGESPDAPK